jgi:ABC-type polar amino acid transport system ATPase subunit
MLKVTNVSKAFGRVTAVDDLSLEIRPGEVFGLLGPNGAGKTTTINMAIGQSHPDKGTVAVESHGSPSAQGVRRMLGVAPQAWSIYENLRVRCPASPPPPSIDGGSWPVRASPASCRPRVWPWPCLPSPPSRSA